MKIPSIAYEDTFIGPRRYQWPMKVFISYRNAEPCHLLCRSSLESSAEPWHLLHVRHEEEAKGEDEDEEDGVVVPLVADAVDIG